MARGDWRKSLEVKVISNIEAKRLLDSFDRGHYSPLGKFILYDEKVVVAIDNETGNAWTEEFSKAREAIAWLLDPEIKSEEQKRYDTLEFIASLGPEEKCYLNNYFVWDYPREAKKHGITLIDPSMLTVNPEVGVCAIDTFISDKALTEVILETDDDLGLEGLMAALRHDNSLL